MEQFLEKLYNYEYFGTYLMISIAVLVLLFIVILFFGKKDQKNREIEATKKLQQINNDTFKDDSIMEKVEVPNNNIGVNPLNTSSPQNLNDTMVMPSLESINEFANRELNQFNQSPQNNLNNQNMMNNNSGQTVMPQNNVMPDNSVNNISNNMAPNFDALNNLNSNIVDNKINEIETPVVNPMPVEQVVPEENKENAVTPDLNSIFPNSNEQPNNLFDNLTNNINIPSNDLNNGVSEPVINPFVSSNDNFNIPSNTNESSNNNKPLLDKTVDKPFQFSDVNVSPFNSGFSDNLNVEKQEVINNNSSEMAVPEFNFDDIMKTIEEPKKAEVPKEPEMGPIPVRKFSEDDFKDQATAPYSNNYVKSPSVFSSVYAPPKEEKIVETVPNFDFDYDKELENVPSTDEIDIELPSLKAQEDNTSINIELPNLNDYNKY